jgi:hypothetical protein
MAVACVRVRERSSLGWDKIQILGAQGRKEKRTIIIVLFMIIVALLIT